MYVAIEDPMVAGIAFKSGPFEGMLDGMHITRQASIRRNADKQLNNATSNMKEFETATIEDSGSNGGLFDFKSNSKSSFSSESSS